MRPQLLVLHFALAEAGLRRAQGSVGLDEGALGFVALAAELAERGAQLEHFAFSFSTSSRWRDSEPSTIETMSLRRRP
jgi:hypothetical protein